jgi:hypothetical protein
MHRRFASLAIALVAVPAFGLTGCSSSAPKTAPSATTAGGSIYEVVPDERVTAGLVSVQALNGQAVARLATDQAAAQELVDEIYDDWYAFEGTIKTNSIDLYLALEDGLGAMKNGIDQKDADKAATGAAAFATAADRYLQQWPGTAPGTTP